MEFVDYVRLLRRRWVTVAVAALVGVGAAALWTLSQTPIYESRTRVLVTGGDSGLALAPAQVASFAGQRPIVDAASAQAGIAGGAGSVTATSAVGEPFVDIVVRGPDPARAVSLAAAIPVVLPAQLAALDQIPSEREVELRVIDGPTTSGSPVSPRPAANLALGLAVGLLVGLLAAVARELLDRRLVESHEIEQSTHLPVLSVIPQELSRETLVVRSSPQALRSEAYRKLRANLLFTTAEGLPSSILITSPSPGEGKSSVAMNLGLVCAAAGDRVALVDGDLRRPVVAKEYGLSRGPGLSDVLRGTEDLDSCLQDSGTPGLVILSAGRPVDNPSEILKPDALKAVVDRLGRGFDVVIVDAPPVIPVADPLQIASTVSGVLLVTRLGATTQEAMSRALRTLERVGVPVLGLVPNAATGTVDKAYGYGGYYYRSKESPESGVSVSRGGRRRSRSQSP